MKKIRILLTDLTILGLMVAGLCYKIDWAWNISAFIAWVIFVCGVLITFAPNTDGFKRRAANGEIRRTMPKWWHVVFMVFACSIMAAHGHYGYAGVYTWWYVACIGYFSAAEELDNSAD